MDRRIQNFYSIPDISEYEDTNLQVLREECGSLEERVYRILEKLPDFDRQVIETYLEARNELEFQLVKTALRCGGKFYRH